MEQEQYQKIYSDFMASYTLGAVSGEQVGEVIARLAGFFPNFNLNAVKAERIYALTLKNEILKTDETTGKAVSAVKAETIAAASDEAFAFKVARAHTQNIESLVGSLKFLQKGLLTEYSQSNLG